MGHAADPHQLLRQGVRDMVRHLGRAHERHQLRHLRAARVARIAKGGPLALVRDGDLIELDVPARRIQVRITDAEMAKRRKAWRPLSDRHLRGYGWLFAKECTQAHEGCDFKFLHAGQAAAEPDIY